MKLLAAPAFVLTALFASLSVVQAMTFDERWKSLFGVSDVITEAVSAKAEFVPGKDAKNTKEIKRPTRHAHRYQVRRSKSVRVREWYKGGKKWRYVYKRR